MRQLQPHTFTKLLLEWRNGNQSAHEEVMRLAYQELYKRAKRHISRERPGHLLQATALINEVYLRLVRAGQLDWECRNDFFAICARLMRNILIDMANAANAKINRDEHRVSVDEGLEVSQKQPVELIDLLALDQALRALAELNPRQSRVVELRYFGGLTMEEVASVLKVSYETVKRDWRLAKVWLLHELSKKGGER